MSVLAALGTAAAQAVGPLISTAGQLYTNRQNLKNQNYWNEVSIELANSAHQREVQDLEKAGLNPILSSGGSGASTPSLHAATLQNPTSSFGNSAKSIGDALMGKASAELKQARADADTSQAYADVASDLARAEQNAAELQRIENDAKIDALRGTVSVQNYVNSGASYGDLIDQYKNEIKSGKYKSSLGHAIYEDIREGVSSAGDLIGVLKNAKSLKDTKKRR